MKARRPYLLRAIHEWISDSLCTPHLVVDANAEPAFQEGHYFHDTGRIEYSGFQKRSVLFKAVRVAEKKIVHHKIFDFELDLFHWDLSCFRLKEKG